MTNPTPARYAAAAERAAKQADAQYKTARDAAQWHAPALSTAALYACRAAASVAYAAALAAHALAPDDDDTARARRASDAAALAAADAQAWQTAELEQAPALVEQLEQAAA